MQSPYDTRLSPTGEGPLLVFVPGMDGTGRMFYGQAPLLARCHRVVALVLLGWAIAGIRIMPWRIMPLGRQFTAFRLHSRSTPPSEIGRFGELTQAITKDGDIARLGILRHLERILQAWRRPEPT